MKKIIVTIVFLFIADATIAQYIMSIKKNDNTKQNILVSEISEITFLDCGNTITYEGQIYNTVLIGTQCWLKENLNVGTQITGATTQTNNSTIEKCCYNDDPANCTTYGGMYQWAEAMQYVTTSGAKGICPTGWHIPTIAELTALKAAVSNDGNSLKAIGQGSGSGAGTNTSGFSALLAGTRSGNGTFSDLGAGATFWSSTEDILSSAYGLGLWYGGSDSNVYSSGLEFGFSIRCLKD